MEAKTPTKQNTEDKLSDLRNRHLYNTDEENNRMITSDSSVTANLIQDYKTGFYSKKARITREENFSNKSVNKVKRCR